MKRTLQFLLFGGLSLVSAGCASRGEFKSLYDHYFPAHTDDVRVIYRRSYDRWMFGDPPPKLDSSRITYLYFAFHGDLAAGRAFLRHPDRDADGEPGESWTYDCVLLLIRLGDDRFSEMLAREDARTREAVGIALDPQVHWSIHRFPKTRSLYAYRYVRKPV